VVKISDDWVLSGDTVEETMYMPLWGRGNISKIYPKYFHDPKAEEIVKNLDYDFSKVESFYTNKGIKEYYSLTFCARANNFDDALLRYMENNPQTIVVNLGAGLDTTFSRIDNGKILFYNLDLPDAIEIRTKFIPETDRQKCISKSVFDYSWFENVKFSRDKGIFFLAGGLFMYFEEEKVKLLFKDMAERFSGGELIFDGSSKLGCKIANRGLQKAGHEEVMWRFHIGNPKKLFARWSKKIELVDTYAYWKRTPKIPQFEKKTKKLMRITSFLKMGKFVHVRFLE